MPLTLDISTDFGQRASNHLDTDQVVWLVTVSPSGRPMPSVVWFLRESEDTVLICSQPDVPKVRAIRQNPRVALHFNSTEHGGDVAVFSGTAELLEQSTSEIDTAAYARKYAGGLESLSMSIEQFAADYSQPIRLTLEKVRGY